MRTGLGRVAAASAGAMLGAAVRARAAGSVAFQPPATAVIHRPVAPVDVLDDQTLDEIGRKLVIPRHILEAAGWDEDGDQIPAPPPPQLRTTPANKPSGFDWFKRVLGSPKYWVAPMVDQSELPFRMLAYSYGATAAYTPMIHARLFLKNPKLRGEFTTCSADGPVLAQFCGNDPQVVLAAARTIEHLVDGVDFNLGCPQGIARRGNYGAFLMEDWPLIATIIETLHTNLSVPVTAKIRLVPTARDPFQVDLERSVEYAKMLEAAGAQMIGVHGRTRIVTRPREVLADWDTIAAIKAAVNVPVIANGNIQTWQDVESCLAYTKADGVMSADTLLANPALFNPGASPTVDDLALQYLDLAERFPAPIRCARAHLFKLYETSFLQGLGSMRPAMARTFSLGAMRSVVGDLIQARSDLAASGGRVISSTPTPPMAVAPPPKRGFHFAAREKITVADTGPESRTAAATGGSSSESDLDDFTPFEADPEVLAWISSKNATPTTVAS